MPVSHHPDGATLISYSAGALPEALAVVVATHIAMCPDCRKAAAALDVAGGAILAGLTPVGVALAAPNADQAQAMLPDEGDHVLAAIDQAGDIPAPMSRLLGSELAAVQWRRLGLGVWHVPVRLSNPSRGDLRLIKVAPGQALPEHGHGGSELSLILAGSYTDEIGRFEVGDLADLDDTVEHKPYADPVVGCVCLIASEGKVRFKGLIARMVQPFVGI